MLRTENLNFSYHDREVLHKINISIKERDFLAIIGPNGSGKSTLLKNLSRALRPDQGLVYLDYKLLNEYKSNQLARKMAVVPQDTNVNFNFTVYDLIMMGRNPYQDRWGRIRNEDRQAVEDSMELTDTSQFKDKKIKQLSGGERQRVIIARALAQQPEILLLDEPTASLDINYQGEVFDLLSYLNKKLKMTIIVVSHDLNLTAQYCKQLLLLEAGKIYAVGTPEEVLTVKNISSVYRADVIIKENPLSKRPYVTLIPRDYRRVKVNQHKEPKIHVICGGGSGKELLEQLFFVGYQLSCGVLNQGDSDWEVAKRLNIDLVEVPPFAAIEQKHLDENKSLMEKADLIIITDTPFGHGNLGNLKVASEIKDKKIVLETRRDIKERDYTGGTAEKYWFSLVNRRNSYLAAGLIEILETLENNV